MCHWFCQSNAGQWGVRSGDTVRSHNHLSRWTWTHKSEAYTRHIKTPSVNDKFWYGTRYHQIQGCKLHMWQMLAGKSVMADEIQSNIHSTATATIEAIDFDNYLSRLESCESYSALKTACNEMELEIPPLDVHHEAIFVTDITQIDPSAQRLYPDDAPRSMYPCKSTANGNCLPSSASVFAFNSLQRTSEMSL